ncbi:hypothetical protein [Delftia sp. UME58]|nr:hypothetical protein [Delftia sp. UME58]
MTSEQSSGATKDVDDAKEAATIGREPDFIDFRQRPDVIKPPPRKTAAKK